MLFTARFQDYRFSQVEIQDDPWMFCFNNPVIPLSGRDCFHYQTGQEPVMEGQYIDFYGYLRGNPNIGVFEFQKFNLRIGTTEEFDPGYSAAEIENIRLYSMETSERL